MFKLGRGGGGGRGNGKRPAPPPLAGRPVGAAAHSRLSHTGRGRSAAPPEANASAVGGQGKEETFSMVSRDKLDFGAIIRLAPDLVDEIRKAEARGGPVRIKFNSNTNDPSGNVLDVDGKEFKFTWSKDSGDLCNIYEERHNGEDGNGILIERGSAWRKLNVQRILDESLKNHVKMRSEEAERRNKSRKILDESLKNHVKMRSEEAERRNKSRKAIVLDPANPTVKNHSTAAVEGSMRRMHWNKKKEPPFKKQKVESTQGSLKSTLKMAPSKHKSKARHSVSPHSSPPEKLGVDSLASPLGSGNVSKVLVSADIGASTAVNQEDAVNSEKELNRSGFKASNKVAALGEAINSRPTDLRSLLITLLLENPKGMSLKALEKSVGETMTCSPKMIENALKSIAKFQAPGRYLLNSGVGVDGNTPISVGGSPDPGNALEEKDAVEPIKKIITEEFEQQVDIDSPDEEKHDPFELIFEKSDDQQTSPDVFPNDVKVDNNSEGKAGSSSDSGSDSDSESESSDSGSDSGSQSKSPAGSGSASSSDSESDGSSSSKESDDVEVNITTSDDEADEVNNKSSAAKLKSSASSEAWRTYEPNGQNGLIGGDKDDAIVLSSYHSPFPERNFDGAQILEKFKDVPSVNTFGSSGNPVSRTADSIGNADTKNNLAQFNESTPLIAVNQKRSVNDRVDSDWGLKKNTENQHVFPGRERPVMSKDVSDHEQPQVSERTPKSRFKRLPESANIMEKVENIKKTKPFDASMEQRKDHDTSELQMASSKYELTQFSGSAKNMTNNAIKDSSVINDMQKEGSSVVHERFNVYSNMPIKGPSPDFQNGIDLDAQEMSRRPGDFSGRRKSFSKEASDRFSDSFEPGAKYSERSTAYPEESEPSSFKNMLHKDKFSIGKDRYGRDSRDEMQDLGEKYTSVSTRDSNLGNRPSFHDTVTRKSGMQARNQNDDILASNMQKSEMDKQKPDVDKRMGASGKGSILKRELSDLELGEFREPTNSECLHASKRTLERKGSFKISENRVNTDDDVQSDLGKKKNTPDVAYELKKQSPISDNRNKSSQEALPRKMSESSVKPQHRAPASQSQQFRRFEQADSDPKSHFDRHSDPPRREETRGNHRKTPASGSDMHPEGGSRFVTEHMQQNDLRHYDARESTDRKNDGFRRDADSSADRMEDTEDKAVLLFSKYEKDEPDLRGPIRDYSQYKEYVQEFEEKYKCYLCLNDFMERSRAEFLKIGGNYPELAKRKDKKAYGECCKRILNFCHKYKMRDERIKKTFVLLHEELKTLKQRIKEFAVEYSKD